MNKPFFSICIPFYNSSKFFSECLGSIKNQTFKDYEIVIYNDGSTSPQTKEMKKYLFEYGIKAKILGEKKNKGSYLARYEMLKNISGKYLLSIDPDDMLVDKNSLKKLHEHILSNPSDVVLFNATRKIDNTNYLNYDQLKSGLNKGIGILRNEFANYSYLNSMCFKAINTKLITGIKKETNEKITLCDDRIILSCILDKANNFSIFDEPIYFYRLVPNSTTTNIDVANSFRCYCITAKITTPIFNNWLEVKFDENKWLLQSGIYALLYNVFIQTNNRDIRIQKYKELREEKLVEGIRFDLSTLKPHRKTLLKFWIKRKYKLVDLYFSLIKNVKKLLKKKEASSTI